MMMVMNQSLLIEQKCQHVLVPASHMSSLASILCFYIIIMWRFVQALHLSDFPE